MFERVNIQLRKNILLKNRIRCHCLVKLHDFHFQVSVKMGLNMPSGSFDNLILNKSLNLIRENYD